MIFNKSHVSDFLFCQYSFAKNIVNEKYQQVTLPENYTKIRKHIADIAAYELKNACKLSPIEYRTRYTNKFFTTKKQLLNLDNTTVRLNGIFEAFFDKKFIGYNIPVDIPIPKTNIIFRSVVDFGMVDSENNAIFVQIDKIDDIGFYKNKLRNWPHYFTLYSYLAKEFKKNVTVIILDPVSYQKIEMIFTPDRFDKDIEVLSSVLQQMASPCLVKNLFACSSCINMGKCK